MSTPTFAAPRLARTPVRMSIGSRRNPASHTAILDAADHLLAERGPAGVTIDAVARDARAGKPTVYRWWPDRLALFTELHARAVATLAAPAFAGNIADDLRALATTILDAWTTTNAGPALRAIVAEAQATPLARERADAALSNYRDAIACLATRHGATLDVEATFESWLAAFLFRPAAADAAIARQIDTMVAALPTDFGDVRDRRDWAA